MLFYEGMISIVMRKFFFIILGILCYGGVTYGQLQSPEQIHALASEELTPYISTSPSGLIENNYRPSKTAASNTDHRISVNAFRVQGATLIGEQEIAELISPYEGRKLTMADMQAVADGITNRYRALGFLLSYAYLPPQEVVDGVVKIIVVEGRLDDVIVSGNKYYSTKFIEGYFEDLVRKGKEFKAYQLEKQLLLLNDFMNLDVYSVLKAGEHHATASLQVEVEDRRPWQVTLTADNYGARTISKHRLGAELVVANIWHDGDELNCDVITGLDRISFERLMYGRLEYYIPYNNRGGFLGAYYANSIYQAGKDYAILDIHGKANVAGVYFSQVIKRKAYRTMSVRGGFEYQDVYDYMLEEARSKDKIRALEVIFSCDWKSSWKGRNIIETSYRRGLGHFLGGKHNNSQSSRNDASGDFNKLNLDFTRIQGLFAGHYLWLRGRGQYSNNNLMVAEQFMLGGISTVRGYRPSIKSGDKGYLFNGELFLEMTRKMHDLGLFKLVTAYLVPFVDHGGTYFNATEKGEESRSSLTSIGLGVRVELLRHLRVRMDWAVPRYEGSFNARDSEILAQASCNF
ncbi:MAG: ShlB/FhaC/HecB family hemolysin secretion/activation protein [Chlamydiota bacterium]